MDEMNIGRPARPNLSLPQKELLKSKKYAPATGVQVDFEKILLKFVETKSVRYEDFAKIWLEKKVSLICAGRQSMREAKEFMEECLKIAVKMFLPPYGFQARVGALYLLYGLYYTQPCHPKVKIRVTREAWTHITNLQKDFQEQNHHDTNYILCKLLTDRAFVFCHSFEEARRLNVDQPTDNKTVSSVLTEEKQPIDELFSDEVIEQLNLIHTQYHQLKVKLAGPDATRPDRSLDVLQDRFPSAVTEHLVKHHERCQKKKSMQQSRKRRKSASDDAFQMNSEDENDSDPDNQTSKKTVGQRRAALKKQAFSGAKNVQRHKHRALIVESGMAEGYQTSKKGQGRGRHSKSLDSQPDTPRDKDTQEPDQGDNEATSESVLLSMPHMEEAETSRTGQRPGRPRKTATPAMTSPTSPRKRASGLQRQVSDSLEQGEDGEDNSEGGAVTAEGGKGRPDKQSDGSSKSKKTKAASLGSEKNEDDGQSDEDVAQPSITPKRGRGRPPKQKDTPQKTKKAADKDDDTHHFEASKMKTQGTNGENNQEKGATPAKKKRGQPPKEKATPGKSTEGVELEEADHNREEVGDQSDDDLPMLVRKRGRGRPKQPEDSPPKKRGRPPKGKGPVARPHLQVKIGKK